MKLRASIAGLVCCLAIPAFGAEDFIDRLGDALTFTTHGDQVRGRLSGTFDLEAYGLQQPSPALVYSTARNYFNPRLSLFVDAQLGPRVYAFAQTRADRGFDPGDSGRRWRLDEFAVRFSLGSQGRFHVQAGKFATVVGNWVQRHGSWQNPFVTAPLPYENLTGIWDTAAARSSGQLLAWAHVKSAPAFGNEAAEKILRTPIIWGPSYTTGVAVFGGIGRMEAALEIKNAALSSHPESWNADHEQWRYPTCSARLAYRPNAMWNLGVSASTGPYLRTSAISSLAGGRTLDDYRQVVIAQDLGFAWHHWQVWAEVYAARFAVPNVGNADTLAYYAELKYKFTPRLFGAARWNEQLFDTIPDSRGGRTRWGRPARRIDISAGYRFTAHIQLKLQYTLQLEDTARYDSRQIIAGQLTVRL